MILIEELPHLKLGGDKSLFVSFSYLKDFKIVTNLIKSTGSSFYHVDLKKWEVPVTQLAYLLDNLIYYDDISLKMLKNEEKRDVKLVVNYKTKPYNYQLDGIKFGLSHDKFFLLDSPGLGKTLQVIYLAQELKAQKGIQHCLIICGVNSLKLNWEKEIHTHSNETCRVLGKKVSKKGNVSYASLDDRAKELIEPISEFFVILNVEALGSKQIIKALLKSKNKFDMIAFDEAHRIGTWDSNKCTNLFKLEAPYKVAMTGTLLTNNPVSAYTPLVFLEKEQKRNLGNFKKTYCILDLSQNHRVVGYKNLDLLQQEIDSCSIRRTKEMKDIIPDLPPKTIIVENLDMSSRQESFYESVRKIIKEECDKIDLKNNLLSLCTRLRQVTSCPSVLTTQNIPNIKIDRATELAEDIISGGHKVVIFSDFKEPINELYKRLEKYKPLLATGDVSDGEVSENVDKFQKDDEHMVFLATYARCSVGLTLNRAEYMICIDERYTYADNLQAEDRIHRISNTKPVFIYKLICNNTFDEKVHEIVCRKKDLSDYVIDKDDNANVLARLSNIVKDIIKD